MKNMPLQIQTYKTFPATVRGFKTMPAFCKTVRALMGSLSNDESDYKTSVAYETCSCKVKQTQNTG